MKIEIELSDEAMAFFKKEGQDPKRFAENLINLTISKLIELKMVEKLGVLLTKDMVVAEGEKVGKEVFEKSKEEAKP
jgi:hypothetical protein